MKLSPSTHSRTAARPAPARRTSAGVALVITLIMVSVIAFMAITFLILSSRERGSVSTAGAQTDARLAAESGLQRATAQLLAGIIVGSNADNYGMMVSTNFVNPRGFDPAPTTTAPDPDNRTNVNYEYYTGTGLPLDTNAASIDQLSNLTNLLYDPRPPVFVPNIAGGMEFRYYLDLNRNGRFDTNGIIPVIVKDAANADQYMLTNAGGSNIVLGVPNYVNYSTALKSLHVGDPEWIGILERPEAPHSSSNKFIARFAYLVVPTGRALDVNFIHNQAKGPQWTKDRTREGFFRNQGVGSWELNLAGFLADLNTNEWDNPTNLPYNYFTNATLPSEPSVAFSNAFAILNYRYGLSGYLGLTNGLVPPDRTNIDEYANGNEQGHLMTGTTWTNDGNDILTTNNPNPPYGYPGLDNVNRYYSHQDYFDTNKVGNNFIGHLMAAGTRTNDYDRYTFYRLLEQLGTDSAVDPRMNLNYDNLTPTNGVAATTNYLAWEPVVFFTNAANRMLAAYSNQAFVLHDITNYPNSVSHIQLYPTNLYTASVHRVLQLAANLYDASTNRFPFTNNPIAGNTNLAAPSVFRPIFTNFVEGTNDYVYIIGYNELTNDAITNTFYRDLDVPADRTALATQGASNMVYGVPCMLGAKKFLPNFNEFAFQTVARVTRKLTFTRASASDVNSAVISTNQMLIFAVSNAFGAEFWNAYDLRYPRDVVINFTNELLCDLTNESNGYFSSPGLFKNGVTSNLLVQGLVTNYPATGSTPWAAFDPDRPSFSFKVPFFTNYTFLSNLIYLAGAATPHFVSNAPAQADTNYFYAFTTNWNLRVKNRFRAVVSDRLTGRILDYVNFSGMDHSIQLSKELIGNVTIAGQMSSDGRFWQTNRLGGSTSPNVMHIGGWEQILTSLGAELPQVTADEWRDYAGVLDKDPAIAEFQNEMGLPVNRATDRALVRHYTFAAPFQPTRAIYIRESWQANDPLVHYTLADLTDLKQTNKVLVLKPPYESLPPLTSNFLFLVNARYQPWNLDKGENDIVANPAFKDPWVRSASDWDFPTNKFPSLGWIGRVHRGTPWQTIYLKSAVADTNLWKEWTGNSNDIDSTITTPTNDFTLSRLFTAVDNDNAGRGRLSVNQTNLAAWSAALAGVLVMSNDLDDDTLAGYDLSLPRSYSSEVFDRAGLAGSSSPLGRIVTSLNATRSTNLFANPADAFAAPGFTLQSPYLNTNNPIQLTNGITEAMYERIPQQILGLLSGGENPRFVIYAYGQSLKPAESSIIQRTDRAGFSGLCTNYQITGEVALRAVVGTAYTNGSWRAVIESYNTLGPDN